VNRATPLKINPGHFGAYDEDPEPLRTGERTALMYAAAAGRVASITMLLQHGVNDRAIDAEGLTALDYARSEEARNALRAAHR